MSKIKLPRKRKKAFIKARGCDDYFILTILGEIQQEEGGKLADRYYTYKECKPTKEHPNGYKPIKRW